MPNKPKTSAKKTGKKKVPKAAQQASPPASEARPSTSLEAGQHIANRLALQNSRPQGSIEEIQPQPRNDAGPTLPTRPGTRSFPESGRSSGADLGIGPTSAARAAPALSVVARAKASSFHPVERRAASAATGRGGPSSQFTSGLGALRPVRAKSPSPPRRTASEVAFDTEFQDAIEQAERAMRGGSRASSAQRNPLQDHDAIDIDLDGDLSLLGIEWIGEITPENQQISRGNFDPLHRDLETYDSSPVARSGRGVGSQAYREFRRGFEPGADLFATFHGVGPGSDILWYEMQASHAARASAAKANSTGSIRQQSASDPGPFKYNLYHLALLQALPAIRQNVRRLKQMQQRLGPDTAEAKARRPHEVSPQQELRWQLEDDRIAKDAIKAQLDGGKAAKYIEDIKEGYAPESVIWIKEARELFWEAIELKKPVHKVADEMFKQLQCTVRKPFEDFNTEPTIRQYIYAIWDLDKKFPRETRAYFQRLQLPSPVSSARDSSSPFPAEASGKGSKRKSPDLKIPPIPRAAQRTGLSAASDPPRSAAQQKGEGSSQQDGDDTHTAPTLKNVKRNPAAEARSFPVSHVVNKNDNQEAQADLEVLEEYANLAKAFDSGDEARLTVGQRRSILRRFNLGVSVEDNAKLNRCNADMMRRIHHKLESFDPSPDYAADPNPRTSTLTASSSGQTASGGPKPAPLSPERLNYINQQHAALQNFYRANSKPMPPNAVRILRGLAEGESADELSSKHRVTSLQVTDIVTTLSCTDTPVKLFKAPTLPSFHEIQPAPLLPWQDRQPVRRVSRQASVARPQPSPVPEAVGKADVEYLDLQMQILLSLDTSATGGYARGIYASVLTLFDAGDSDEAISAATGVPPARLRRLRQILENSGTPANEGRPKGARRGG